MRPERYIFILMILFSLSFPSLAADTYKDWIYDNGAISFDGKTLKVTVIPDKVKIDSEGFIMILNEDQCVYVDNIDACLMNITYDLEKESYKAQINLTKKYADLAVTRKLSSSTLILSEENYVDVTLENKGNNVAKNIVYIESIPNTIAELGSCDNCEIEGESVIFKDSIGSKEKITFRYYFTPLSVEEYNYNAKVEYYSKEKKEEFYTSSLKLSPSHPIKVTFTYNTFERLGDEVELSAVITNTQEEDVEIDDIQAYIPSNLDSVTINRKPYLSGKAYSLGGVHLDDRTTTYTETRNNETITKINESETKTLAIKAIPAVLGNYEYIFDIYYEYNERLFKYQGIKSKFTIKGLTPTIKTNPVKNQNFDETSKQDFYIQLMNPYEHISVNDAKLTIDSPLLFGPKTIYVENIPNGVSKRIYFEYLTIPKVNGTAVSTYLQYNLSFYDDYGNMYELNDKIPFKIVPLNNIAISSSGCENVYEDKTCKVTVTVTNRLKGEISSVFVRDTFGSRVTTEGLLYSKIALKGDEKATAYTYEITYPKEEADFSKYVNVTTQASYEYLGEKYSSTSTRIITFEDFSERKDFSLGLSTVFDTSTFYQDSIYPVSLVVENKDDESINNLVLKLKETPDFDLVDFEEKTFEKLNPGEKKYFTLFVKIKSNETASIMGELSFDDIRGYGYEETFKEQKISILPVNPTGPSITITISPGNDEPTVGDLVSLDIKIENKGTEEASLAVRFSKDESPQELYLSPKSYRILKNWVYVQSEGDIIIPPVVSKYEYAKRTYYSSSNELLLSAKPLAIVQEQESEESATQPIDDQNINKNEEPITDNADDSQDILEEDKKEERSWFARVFNRILSFFTF